jgi:hypothetical protein
MTGLNEIKILIIEDERKSAESIKNGLLKININGMQFEPQNIDVHLIESEELPDGTIKHQEPIDIYNALKARLKDKHVLFIDLDLGRGRDENHEYQGYELINYFKSDVFEYYMPKYIITLEENYGNLGDYANEQLVTKTIKKPQDESAEEYNNKFQIEERLHELMPLHVDKYIQLKKHISIEQALQLIMNSLQQQQFNYAMTMDALNVINKLLKSIDVEIMDLQANIAFINQATLTMLKLLPDAIPQNKAQKAKKFIEDNMSEWIKDIGEDFFPHNKQNFIESFRNAIRGIGEDALKDDAKSALRQIIQQVAEEQGIEGEKLAFLSVQLTYKGIASLYSLVTLKA